MVNFKLELTSSPVNKQSRLCREQSNRSPMELVLAGSTPGAMTTRMKQGRLRPAINPTNLLRDPRALSQVFTKDDLVLAQGWNQETHGLEFTRGETCVDFNEYFGLHIRKDSIANTNERVRHKRPVEIRDVPHTEPWTVGENYGRLPIVFANNHRCLSRCRRIPRTVPRAVKSARSGGKYLGTRERGGQGSAVKDSGHVGKHLV
ncbi:hypothetical protein B9Z19DRAFT_1134264 [Tuber borchii]|uniref:Uncharacterized protein n=1 Tax=Tuber borchii TaxID=42251 RepID=A0A2T6ZEF1_TUBBO|nr:hypothetical protein B9Z19DRAFT_1134264 [Tuber borchii]